MNAIRELAAAIRELAAALRALAGRPPIVTNGSGGAGEED